MKPKHKDDYEEMRIEMWKKRFLKLWEEFPKGKGFSRGHIYNKWMSDIRRGEGSLAQYQGHLEAALELNYESPADREERIKKCEERIQARLEKYET